MFDTKVSFYPTVFAIALAVLSIGIPLGSFIGTPWMIAVHTQTLSDGSLADVDTIEFFLWGHEYTVHGVKFTQSQFAAYDWNDFPFFALIGIVISIITGLAALFRYKIKIAKIPEASTLLCYAISFGLLSWVYLYLAAQGTIVPLLISNGYTVTYGIGLNFMGFSAIAFVCALIMTMSKEYKEGR